MLRLKDLSLGFKKKLGLGLQLRLCHGKRPGWCQLCGGVFEDNFALTLIPNSTVTIISSPET